VKHRTTLVISAMLVALALLSTALIAHADGGDITLIHACVAQNGALRIVGPTERCKSNESPLHWNHAIQGVIKFPDGGQIELSDASDVVRRFIFSVPSETSPTGYQEVFAIQDGLLDMNMSPGPEDKKSFFFHWEGGEEGQYVGLIYHPSTSSLVFNLSPQPNQPPVEAVTLTGSLLDASRVDIKGRIYRTQGTEPDITDGSFAFWVDESTGHVFTILNIGGVKYKSLMQP